MHWKNQPWCTLTHSPKSYDWWELNCLFHTNCIAQSISFNLSANLTEIIWEYKCISAHYQLRNVYIHIQIHWHLLGESINKLFEKHMNYECHYCETHTFTYSIWRTQGNTFYPYHMVIKFELWKRMNCVNILSG